MSIISLDPGKRHCGVAQLSLDGTLLRAGLVKSRSTSSDDLQLCADMAYAVSVWVRSGVDLPHVRQLVAERPQVYTQGKQTSADGNWRDPNDLPPLFGVDVGVAVLLRPHAVSTSYLPHTWKGSIAKAALIQQALNRLTPEESARIEPAGALTHNIHDAIGIGLYHVGRLEKRRVYAR